MTDTVFYSRYKMENQNFFGEKREREPTFCENSGGTFALGFVLSSPLSKIKFSRASEKPECGAEKFTKMEVLEKNHSVNQTKLSGSNRIPTLSFMYTEKMSSSTDDSDDIQDPLWEELRNIQSVMHVTRENIDALNAKFANFQEPPSMYIAEYQELTSKLHDLEIKEHELVERLQQNEIIEPIEQPDEVRSVI